MAKRCGTRNGNCPKPRANWWKQSLGVDWFNHNTSGGVDPDISAYEQRIISADGTLSENDLAGLAAFNIAITPFKSKIRDCGFFEGGVNSRFVKFRIGDPSAPSLINVGGLSGNYVEAKGLTNNASNYIRTGIIPANIGLTKDNFSAGYLQTDTNNSMHLGTSKPSGLSHLSISMSNIRVDATTWAPVIVSSNVGRDRFQWVTSNGFVAAGWDYLSKYSVPSTTAVPNVTLDSEVTIFRTINNGSAETGSGYMSFYWIGEYLTYDEIMTLQTAVRTYLRTKGRLPALGGELITFGDSITYGQGASVFTNRWSYKLAANLSLKEQNLGNGSSRYRLDQAAARGGFVRRGEILNYNILHANSKIIFQYGVNDLIEDATVNGDPARISDFVSKHETQINELIALGVPVANIQIGSISIVNTSVANTTKQGVWRDAAQTIAQNTGIKYANVWQYMNDNGGVATLLGDVIHPNNAGHDAILHVHQNLADFV